MCFGVRDAITAARATAADGPVTAFGDLVHNERVRADLAASGVDQVRDLDAVHGRRVMITAHGVSDELAAALHQRASAVLDATCPLVRRAHTALRLLVERGAYPVVIGRPGHVEVRGLIGDYAEASVVFGPGDVARLPDRNRYGVVAQTTQPHHRVLMLVDRIRRHQPTAEVRFVDTVCGPTRDRQQAVATLARRCTVLVIVGSATSNNTRELVATARRAGVATERVNGPDDLAVDQFASDDVVGLTAGTSTPDEVFAAVEDRLRVFAGWFAMAAEST